MIITKKKRFILPLFITFALIGASLLFINLRTSEAAITGWRAGNIMDNAVMTNKSSMSVSKIQSFLNNKVPSCDTYGTKTSEHGGGKDYNGDGRITRAEWGRYYYGQTKFTCLKNYEKDGKSAARIIYNVAQKYAINPQVLLVILQKEQGLVTDTWPLSGQYRTATGYGCPDTAPCNSDYYGLTNQLTWTAKMFRAIINNSPSWYTPYELGNNYIQYSPNSSCGGSTVNIENRATQALYNYTPYQPNKKALDAGWGTASCGAYGNRNFYLYFTNWFGSTRGKFTALKYARWMQTKVDTYKKNPGTGLSVDEVIPAGTQIFFPSKMVVDGKTYLRTEHDTIRGENKGILYGSLEEIDVTFTPLQAPRWMEVISDVQKIDPYTKKVVSSPIPAGTQVYFPTKFEVGGQTYLRSQNDTTAGMQKAIPMGNLRNASISYRTLNYPRWMKLKNKTSLYDIQGTKNIAGYIDAGTHKYFDRKVTVNGITYLRNGPPAPGTTTGVPLRDIEDITYQSLIRPRWLRTSSDNIYKKNPLTGDSLGTPLPKNTEIEFTTKIYVNGKWYLRTKADTRAGVTSGIAMSNLEDLPSSSPIVFEKMKYPHWMATKVNTHKRYPRTNGDVGATIFAGSKYLFNAKVYVNGKWYLRTVDDSTRGITQGILLSELQDTTAP